MNDGKTFSLPQRVVGPTTDFYYNFLPSSLEEEMESKRRRTFRLLLFSVVIAPSALFCLDGAAKKAAGGGAHVWFFILFYCNVFIQYAGEARKINRARKIKEIVYYFKPLCARPPSGLHNNVLGGGQKPATLCLSSGASRFHDCCRQKADDDWAREWRKNGSLFSSTQGQGYAWYNFRSVLYF